MKLTGGLLEAWRPLLRSAHSLACSQGRARMADWNCTNGCEFPVTVWAHAPAWAEQVLQHHILYHVTAPQWSDGYYGQGKSLTVSSRGGPDPKWRLSRSGTAITGICTGSVLEEPKLYGWTSTACTPSHAKNCHMLRACLGPSCTRLLPSGARVWESSHFKLTEAAQMQASGLLLQQLGTQPCPLIGQWWPLSRGEALAHTQFKP